MLTSSGADAMVENTPLTIFLSATLPELRTVT
jgi:hypothetical protein